MPVEVNHTPFFASFTGSPAELAPIRTQLEQAEITFAQTADQITVDLRAQGEGPEALQKGALVLDLIEFYTAADDDL